MPRPSAPSLFIVGWGRVGSALGIQGKAAGIRIVGAESRDPARRRAARKALGRGNRSLQDAELVALAVPEAAISAAATAVAPRLRRGQVVFHLNGSAGLEPLAPVSQVGAAAASLHPYCSISSSASPLRGTACAIDGSPKAVAALRRLASRLGMLPFRRAPGDRLSYHLSAVLTVTAAGVAAAASQRLLQRAGIAGREQRRALAAILRTVAFNLEGDSPGAALTGPFARGDLQRIRDQLEVLKGDPDAEALYRVLGRLSAHLASQLSPEQRAAVEAVLTT